MIHSFAGRDARHLRGVAVIVVLLIPLVLAVALVSMGSESTCAAQGNAQTTEAGIPEILPSLGEQPVRLAALGDVGTGAFNERATANLVAEVADRDEYEGLLLLGDNVYPDGRPDRLRATVFDPFKAVLDDGTTFLPVLGNHDVLDGHACGQVEALGMPGRWYATTIGPALLVALDSNIVQNRDQTEWLEATLAAADARWLIVAMHHPAYSVGYHGSTQDIQDLWVPIFEKYGVDLVLAGHDHDYQRTVPTNGVTYIVSGGGSKTRPTGDADYIELAISVRHFLDIAISDDRLEVTAISSDGPFDHVTMPTRVPGIR